MYKYVNFLILTKYSPEFNKNQGLKRTQTDDFEHRKQNKCQTILANYDYQSKRKILIH